MQCKALTKISRSLNSLVCIWIQDQSVCRNTYYSAHAWEYGQQHHENSTYDCIGHIRECRLITPVRSFNSEINPIQGNSFYLQIFWVRLRECPLHTKHLIRNWFIYITEMNRQEGIMSKHYIYSQLVQRFRVSFPLTTPFSLSLSLSLNIIRGILFFSSNCNLMLSCSLISIKCVSMNAFTSLHSGMSDVVWICAMDEREQTRINVAWDTLKWILFQHRLDSSLGICYSLHR